MALYCTNKKCPVVSVSGLDGKKGAKCHECGKRLSKAKR